MVTVKETERGSAGGRKVLRGGEVVFQYCTCISLSARAALSYNTSEGEEEDKKKDKERIGRNKVKDKNRANE